MSLQSVPYLHQGVSYLQAEDLLINAEKDGSYLVRNSESVQGGYTLCILNDRKVHKYKIIPNKAGTLSLETSTYQPAGGARAYSKLSQVIHELERKGAENGLVCPLLHPVMVQSNTEVDRDTDDDEDDDEESLTERKKSINLSPLHDSSGPTEEFINRFFTQRFRSLDLSDQDGEFQNLLRDYVEDGVHKDYISAYTGEKNLPEFQHLIAQSLKAVERQVDIFLTKLDTCKKLFGSTSASPVVKKKVVTKEIKGKGYSVEKTLESFNSLNTLIGSVESKAAKFLHDFTTFDFEGLIQESGPLMPSILHKKSSRRIIPTSHFQVTNKSNQKYTLSVDIQEGKLRVVKASKNVLNESNVFTHDKIEQLVKCTKNNCRLEFYITGLKTGVFIFNNMRERENFCQVVKQLKDLHSPKEQLEHISLFIGTWNMGFEAPHWNLKSWLRSDGLGKTRPKELEQFPHHLYAIGTQECGISEKDWANKLRDTLQLITEQDMYVVASHNLWNIQLVLLAPAELKRLISHVQTSSVKTGIANTLGNKGAVGISLNFDGSPICFVNSHLTSGHEKNNRRNQNVRDIIKGLSLGPKHLSLFDFTSQFQHVFFLGDLNYRMEGIEPTAIISEVARIDKLSENQGDYSCLLEYDQLKKSQIEKEAFFNFREGDITFPPTYRFEKGAKNNYVWQKHKKTGIRINAPSWCDRVLWKSYPESHIENTSYGCTMELCSSDHKPVFATFDVGITTQFISPKKENASAICSAKIIFKTILAEIRTRCKSNYIVEFHSACLEDMAMSKPNKLFGITKTEGMTFPEWTDKELPVMEPIFSEYEYLEDQYILIAVTDGMESLGDCVVALKSMISPMRQKFEATLVHKGEITGSISGVFNVEVKGSLLTPKRKLRKSYEFVSTDRIELENFDRHPSLDRACSAHPDFARAVDIEDEDWSTNTIYGRRKLKFRSHSSSEVETFDEDKILENNNVRNKSKHQYEEIEEERKHCTSALAKVAEMGANPIDSLAATKKANSDHAKDDENSSGYVIQHGKSFRDAICVSLESMDSLEAQNVAPVPPPRPTRLPPKLPARNFANEKSREKERPPNTVNAWLLDLGLPNYIQTFFKNGWDEIEFIQELDEHDLQKMNITNQKHIDTILESIRKL